MENKKRPLTNRVVTWIACSIILLVAFICIPIWSFLFGEYDENNPPETREGLYF